RVLDSYHEILPEMPSVKILTDTRKKNLRTFWQKFGFDQQRWESYLRYVAENCRWMLEDRPNGSGGFWKRKNLDYLITERCYVAVKEARANDR
ncbi:helix-turn-helix domain-containing protein, partial [Escherichia coli]